MSQLPLKGLRREFGVSRVAALKDLYGSDLEGLDPTRHVLRGMKAWTSAAPSSHRADHAATSMTKADKNNVITANRTM